MQTIVEILKQNAGALESRRNRRTGLIVTLYRAAEAGMENDPETPYCVVCERHGTLVCMATREQARSAMSVPDWCADCQEIMIEKGNL